MPELTTLSELTETPHAEMFEGPPRTVRLELDADDRVPPHSHPGTNVVLHLVSGRLQLTLDEETVDVAPGQLVRFGGDRRISPRALEPSIAVVVFAPAEASDT